jgi:hypothetical protein
MAAIRGNDGIVRNGAVNVVGEIVSFTADAQVSVIEPKAMGDTDQRVLAGIRKWSGTIAVNMDRNDAQQVLIVAGDNVDLRLYPYGIGSGADYLSAENQTPATVLITSEGHNVEVDGVAATAYNWEGTVAWESLP